MRWTAATALRQIAPTEVDTKATAAELTRALKDENAIVRWAAGMALRITGSATGAIQLRETGQPGTGRG